MVFKGFIDFDIKAFNVKGFNVSHFGCHGYSTYIVLDFCLHHLSFLRLNLDVPSWKQWIPSNMYVQRLQHTDSVHF